MRSLRRSILHSVYNVLVALAAFRCAGPTLPALASSWLRQTQVARFLPFWSGIPNQYLNFRLVRLQNRTLGNFYLLEKTPALHCFSMRRLVKATEIGINRGWWDLGAEDNDVERSFFPCEVGGRD
jgi:hypothetical protein